MMRSSGKMPAVPPVSLRILSSQGVTLLESLVTVTILAGIMAVTLSSFSGGLNIYHRLQSDSGGRVDTILFLEQFERDVRNIVNVSQIKFIGDSQRLSFPALIQDSDAGGAPQLGRKSYYYDANKDAVVAQEENYHQVFSGLPPEESLADILAVVAGVQFQYYYLDTQDEAFKWTNVWDGTKGFPAGVQIVVTYQEGELQKTVRETVFIPTVAL